MLPANPSPHPLSSLLTTPRLASRGPSWPTRPACRVLCRKGVAGRRRRPGRSRGRLSFWCDRRPLFPKSPWSDRLAAFFPFAPSRKLAGRKEGRERRRLTRSLQEDDPSREHSRLAPTHPVAQIVHPLLPAPDRPAQSRHRHLVFPALDHGHPHHAPSHACKPRVVVVRVGESSIADPVPLCFRAQLHLRGEVGAWVDAVGFPVGVWDLGYIDAFEVHFDTDARLALGVVHEDEFALPGLGLGQQGSRPSVWRRKGIGLCCRGRGERAGYRGRGLMREVAVDAIMKLRRERWDRVVGMGWIRRIALEDMRWADVTRGAARVRLRDWLASGIVVTIHYARTPIRVSLQGIAYVKVCWQQHKPRTSTVAYMKKVRPCQHRAVMDNTRKSYVEPR